MKTLLTLLLLIPLNVNAACLLELSFKHATQRTDNSPLPLSDIAYTKWYTTDCKGHITGTKFTRLTVRSTGTWFPSMNSLVCLRGETVTIEGETSDLSAKMVTKPVVMNGITMCI